MVTAGKSTNVEEEFHSVTSYRRRTQREMSINPGERKLKPQLVDHLKS
jgi:hypothetical protein